MVFKGFLTFFLQKFTIFFLQKLVSRNGQWWCPVVEHSHHQPKFEGLSPATAGEEMAQICKKYKKSFLKFSWHKLIVYGPTPKMIDF